MAYYTYTKDPIGVFVEKTAKNHFEFSMNGEQGSDKRRFPHKVWVGGEGVCGMWGWRYAEVKKTVAYVCVDEDENGPVVEKWAIMNERRYG